MISNRTGCVGIAVFPDDVSLGKHVQRTVQPSSKLTERASQAQIAAFGCALCNTFFVCITIFI